MAAPEPRIVAWSNHALAKAWLLGIARTDVEDAVLAGHYCRTQNTGAAAWLTTVGRLQVAYNHPDQGDSTTARIVTLWRRA